MIQEGPQVENHFEPGIIWTQSTYYTTEYDFPKCSTAEGDEGRFSCLDIWVHLTTSSWQPLCQVTHSLKLRPALPNIQHGDLLEVKNKAKMEKPCVKN